MIARRALQAVLCLGGLWCGSAAAQEVTLTAEGGGLSVSGTLLGYDGAFYRIRSEYGELTLDGTGLRCDGRACPDTEAFVAKATFSGAETVGRILMPPLIETYARRAGYDLERQDIDERSFVYLLRPVAGEDPPLELTIHLGTSAEGFADLIADEADIAMSLREIDEVEVALAAEAGRGDLSDPRRSRVLALDALVPVVSVANTTQAISVEDLYRLATGDGEDGTILHLPSSEEGLGQAFDQIVLGDAQETPGVVRHGEADALARAVDSDRTALGVTAFSALGNTQALGLRGTCGIVAEATVESIKAEDYPLTAPIFLYAPARRLPDPVRDFIDYAMSPAAQAIIRRAGFVDQFPVRIVLADQGERLINAILEAGDETSLDDLRAMAEAIHDKARLSISFRFEDGSADLDAQSRSNVLLLSQAIERGVFDGRTLSFIGFSDGLGPAYTNRRLSLRRARAVRNAIEDVLDDPALAEVALATEAFGEALPMACDETDWGRRVNRRVEVWLD